MSSEVGQTLTKAALDMQEQAYKGQFKMLEPRVGGLTGKASAKGKASAIEQYAFNLTKAELAEMLFDQVGLNKREAKDMVETFFDEIRASLERGESVKLSGFGNFQLRDKPQRPGRNPKTGEAIPISARRVVTFHASNKLKAAIEGLDYDGEDA
jgi:integration host factor subunit alpha